MSDPLRSALVTGADGYVGRLLLAALERDPGTLRTIVATDVRLPAPAARRAGILYELADVRDARLGDRLRHHGVDVVVHLAAIVDPGRRPDRARAHAVDVLGTMNVVAACLAAGVRKLIVTSSGAAYGYHADNPVPLDEHDALRGNSEFAYSDHKRQVEELLARARDEHPELRQLVLRPGTILGAGTRNQITALFEGRCVLGLRGAASPFVFAWDEDVVGCLLRGLHVPEACGVFNVAGDGALSLREIAALLGKPYLALPVGVVRGALRIQRALGLRGYGPEQIDFLRYRPVLANARLGREFGYRLRKTSREAFEAWRTGAGRG